MARKNRVVVVDSYAIIADLLGEITSRARRVLDSIRLGEVIGLVHYLTVFELAYHWRRGRLPFASEKELLEFIDYYFRFIDIDPRLAIEASRIKVMGDKMLRESRDPRLKRRSLSIADATCIAVALEYRAPIVSGDLDLTFTAKNMGVEVIW